MEFKRRMLVKDLYDIKKIYSSFTELEFKDVKSLINYLEREKVFVKDQYLTVHIYTSEEVFNISYLYVNALKEKGVRLNYYPKTEEAVEAILSVAEEIKELTDTAMTLDYELADYLVANHEEPFYCVQNGTVLKTTYSADNFFKFYKRDVALLLRAHRHRMSYDLRFDYLSFEETPIKTLHLLKFTCNQLSVFSNSNIKTEIACVDEEYERKSGNRRIPLSYSSMARRVFLDENGSVYIDEDLTDCYLDRTKELNFETVSKIRSLSDIKFNNFYNQNLIDIYQNKKVMMDIYVVPHISRLVDMWLIGEEL